MATYESNWERIYSENPDYRSWYPWSEIVSFVFRNAPKNRERKQISILEIGCGTGNNLWFAAREGFRVAGIDISKTAIDFAKGRFAKEGLAGDFRVGDFSKLPFSDGSFDLAFDRGSLSMTNRQGAVDCVAEIRRVIKSGGLFQCGPFSDRDSSFYRSPDDDGLVRDIKVGTILCEQASFYGLQDMRNLFSRGWIFDSLQHIDETDFLSPERVSHSRWLAVLRAV